MRKLFLTAFAFFAMFSYQTVAQTKSVEIDFENGIVDGDDIKNGFGDKYTYETTDNPSTDGVNSSAYALYVERTSEAAEYDGPLLRIPELVIKAEDLSTHYLHFQAMLPEGTVEGKGKFVFNLYSHAWEDSPKDPRLLGDNKEKAQLPFPKDYKAGTWVQFHVDLRNFIGSKLTSMQLQGERGGSLSWYFDNLVIDDQRPDGFLDDKFAFQEDWEDGEDYYVFLEGTDYALTSAPLLSSGNTPTSFKKFDAKGDGDQWFQTWTIETADETQSGNNRALYKLSNDGNYLYSDATVRGLSDEVDYKYYWFGGKLTEDQMAPYFKNYGRAKFIAPTEMMADLEVKTTGDSTKWKFVKVDDVKTYLASAESKTVKVLTQVAAGDYYIFFAGTNYCVTDSRPMKAYAHDKKDANDKVISRDSMYIPSMDRYALVLQVYEEGNDGQKWTVCNYADDIDNDRKHTFFDAYGTKVNGYFPLNTQRWHWVRRSDSITRAVGARLVCGQEWHPACYVDTLDTKSGSRIQKSFTFPYLPVWGDNATMLSFANDQIWFVKRLPYNEAGMVAIYRPNNGLQATYVANPYDGTGLSSTTKAADLKTKNIKTAYVWNFVPVSNPSVQSAEAAKGLIIKDTVFGYPTTMTAGKYRIVYRGTNQVVTKNSYVNDDDETIFRPMLSVYDQKNQDQLWTLTETTEFGYDGKTEYTFTASDGKMMYFDGNPVKHGDSYDLRTFTQIEAESAAKDLNGFAIEIVKADASEFGQLGACLLRGNSFPNKMNYHRYLDVSEKVKGAKMSSDPSVKGLWFTLVPESENIPTPKKELVGVKHVADGYYYIQYAYSWDPIAENKTVSYVMAPADNPTGEQVYRMRPFHKDSLEYAWYICNTDTLARTEGRVGDGRALLYNGDSIRPILAAGFTLNQILNKNATALAIATPYCINDWSHTRTIDDVAQSYEWFRYRFFDHDNKVAMRMNKYINVTLSERLDSLDILPTEANTVNGKWEATGFRKANEKASALCYALDNPIRAAMWYLIPVEGGEPMAVTNYAPWNKHNKINTDEEIVETTVTSEGLDCITVAKNAIVLTDVAGFKVTIYTVTGMKVIEVAVVNAVETIAVPAGIYIVKVNEKSVVTIVK